MERARVLLIGYGNPLRGDDALGPRVVELAVAQLDGVTKVLAHQLTPELAEPLSKAELAVFVDASRAGSGVRVEAVLPEATHAGLFHFAEPKLLLGLARSLYGRAPRAFWVTVEASELTHQHGLSKAGEAQLPAAVARVVELVCEYAARRLALTVRGVVQGVGFRPFVGREAKRRALSGWVKNGTQAVEIEIQGARRELDDFVQTLRSAPLPIRVLELDVRECELNDEHDFRIEASRERGAVELSLAPDLALCGECRSEIFDANARRFSYAFAACASCGPRYSVVRALPYDRERTTLSAFPLCPECLREYEDMGDRRFHAEAIACPRCGPSLALWGSDRRPLAEGAPAIQAAARALAEGQILALKGIGGYQLLVSAENAQAVQRLRVRKQREEKPFAVLFADLESARRFCVLTAEDEALLTSPEAPIVLVPKAADVALAAEVAPDNPNLGAFIAYSPLHALLLAAHPGPVVCTSGNPSAEPLCTEDDAAFARLGNIADLFLTHNRPIARPIDDSIARVTPRGPELLRRARGYAPARVARLPDARVLLGVGAQSKSTLALSVAGNLHLSQHLGDLESVAARELLETTLDDLLAFFAVTPEVVACDLHPDFASSMLAERLCERYGAALVRVQHHVAHVAALAAEHTVEPPYLGFAWDGVGLGNDGTLWGGEAFLVSATSIERVATLQSFPLPGADRAAREPRRSAFGLLARVAPDALPAQLERAFDAAEAAVLMRAIERHVAAPETSSVGRLFDAMASLLGLAQRCSFEGQAAMALEFLAARAAPATAYPLPISATRPYRAELEPLVRAVLADLAHREPRPLIAARFHAALAAYAQEVARACGVGRVLLSGGCFQNAILARDVRAVLERAGFEVYSARAIPTNDAAISAGQVARVSRLFAACESKDL